MRSSVFSIDTELARARLRQAFVQPKTGCYLSPMIKDHAYFLSLSLDSVPDEVRTNPEARAIHELWGDILTAIVLHTQNKPIDTAQMKTVLGVPDRVVDRGDHELWIYDWHGTHGPNRYASETPFIVREGLVHGVSRNTE